MAESYGMFIGGRWVASEGGAVLEATSPSTGEPIGTVPEGTREDARRAIDAAGTAFTGWAALSAFDRAAAMRRVAEAVDAARERLADTLTLDQGKPRRAEALDEVEELIAYFDMAAADATRMEGLLPPSVDARKRVLLQRVPRGVVAVISPWNWPYTMPGELLAPALAYGNTVAWAAAPTTSVCAVRLAECLEAADLPPGVVNLVTGPGPVVGDELAASPGTQAVGFIGSIATGHTVARRAAGKELLLEMGGNGPLVVMDDADLDAAVDATLEACFLNAGQSCTAGERVLVHQAARDDYLARLVAAVGARVRLGDPFDDATTMGPLNNGPTAAKTERHVTQALELGATLVA
ncbi:MAG TPA: aldehyde dehydrogenase family protein, partial [Actinomycetota bacterium]|nr:aldehyde dehydrogenase family protein [Actinomycetota bacterium]